MTARRDRERAALVVHEVRSPTAALAAIVVALTEGELDDNSVRALVGLSLAACESIERIMDDAALGSLRLEEIDVADVAQVAVTSAMLGGARIRTSFDAGLPLVLGDRVRLRQAFDNLIENAVAAAGSEGDVLVGIRTNAFAVVVSVADRGGGIPMEEQARIFEPGVRLAPQGGGSGLGLAIVRAIAEAHGGTAAVVSAPGMGATFTIALPIVRAHPAGTASST